MSIPMKNLHAGTTTHVTRTICKRPSHIALFLVYLAFGIGEVRVVGQTVGQPVLLISPADLYVKREIIDSLGPEAVGLSLYMTAIDGDWLWVSGGRAFGWIHRRHVSSLADAEAYFSGVIASDAQGWNGYFGRANARLHLGRASAAVSDLTRAIALAPVDLSATLFEQRAEANLAVGEYERAFSDAEDAIHRATANKQPRRVAAAYYVRGFVRHMRGELRDAEADYEEAILRNPKLHIAVNRRAVLFRDTGRFEQAVEGFSAVLSEIPTMQIAQHDRGTTLEMMGDYPAAAQDYRAVLKQAPDAVFVGQSRESAVYGDRRTDVSSFQLLDPNRSTYYKLIMLLSACPDDSIRDGKEAVALAQKLRELDGGRYWAFIVAEAAAYAEAGDFATAIQLQQKAVELAPDKERGALSPALEAFRAGKPWRLPAPDGAATGKE